MLTAQQLALRLTGIGASEIGSVLGADGAWDSPVSVWARKIGVSSDGGPTPEHIELGDLLEPVIATLYARRKGYALTECGTLVHPNDPLQIATPDRLVTGTRRGAQIKKARSRATWGEEGTDEVPENIICQVQWEMSVADLDVEDVPVLFWGSKLCVYTVHRDNELIGNMVDLAHQWWRDYVVTRMAPPVDGSEKTRDAIGHMFKKHNGTLVQLGEPMPGTDSATVFALMREYQQAHEDVKAAEARKDQVGNALRLKIGENDGYEGPFGKVTWRRDSKGKVSWKGVAEALAPSLDLISQHTGEPGRKLLVSLKGI